MKTLLCLLFKYWYLITILDFTFLSKDNMVEFRKKNEILGWGGEYSFHINLLDFLQKILKKYV